MYPRNAWYVAAWDVEFAREKPEAVVILGEPIVLFRDSQGKLAALEDRCPHKLAPLSLGRCEGDRLRCMYHGILFDRGGRAVEVPGQDMIPHSLSVRSYPVTVRGTWVWIWMGDAEKVDEALIPETEALDSPNYLMRHGMIDYDASAHLICENLLDLSHLSFVHENSFGSSANDEWSNSPPFVTTLDRGVRIGRWIRNRRYRDGRTVDHWNTYDFLVPGILTMAGYAFPVGTADGLEGAPEAVAQDDVYSITCQAVTPVSEGKARYFFSAGVPRGTDEEARLEQLFKVTLQAFAEDKMMIEAQQKVIAQVPGRNFHPIGADRATTLYQRVARKLEKIER